MDTQNAAQNDAGSRWWLSIAGKVEEDQKGSGVLYSFVNYFPRTAAWSQGRS